ncbi:MAG TPA: regulatory protein RecX [Solirubrobacteraceae bacterium]
MPDAEAGTSTDEQLQKAFQLSFAYLNRRERTVGELRLQLERKGVSHRLAEQVIGQLVEDGYLDDSRFALMFVHDKRELGGWGSDRIRRELGAKGLDRDLIESALERHEHEFAGDETELDRALALLRGRFSMPHRDRRERDRALGALVRKGFDSELAVDALAAYARGAD